MWEVLAVPPIMLISLLTLITSLLLPASTPTHNDDTSHRDAKKTITKANKKKAITSKGSNEEASVLFKKMMALNEHLVSQTEKYQGAARQLETSTDTFSTLQQQLLLFSTELAELRCKLAHVTSQLDKATTTLTEQEMESRKAFLERGDLKNKITQLEDVLAKDRADHVRSEYRLSDRILLLESKLDDAKIAQRIQSQQYVAQEEKITQLEDKLIEERKKDQAKIASLSKRMATLLKKQKKPTLDASSQTASETQVQPVITSTEAEQHSVSAKRGVAFINEVPPRKADVVSSPTPDSPNKRNKQAVICRSGSSEAAPRRILTKKKAHTRKASGSPILPTALISSLVPPEEITPTPTPLVAPTESIQQEVAVLAPLPTPDWDSLGVNSAPIPTTEVEDDDGPVFEFQRIGCDPYLPNFQVAPPEIDSIASVNESILFEVALQNSTPYADSLISDELNAAYEELFKPVVSHTPQLPIDEPTSTLSVDIPLVEKPSEAPVILESISASPIPTPEPIQPTISECPDFNKVKESAPQTPLSTKDKKRAAALQPVATKRQSTKSAAPKEPKSVASVPTASLLPVASDPVQVGNPIPNSAPEKKTPERRQLHVIRKNKPAPAPPVAPPTSGRQLLSASSANLQLPSPPPVSPQATPFRYPSLPEFPSTPVEPLSFPTLPIVEWPKLSYPACNPMPQVDTSKPSPCPKFQPVDATPTPTIPIAAEKPITQIPIPMPTAIPPTTAVKSEEKGAPTAPPAAKTQSGKTAAQKILEAAFKRNQQRNPRR